MAQNYIFFVKNIVFLFIYLVNIADKSLYLQMKNSLKQNIMNNSFFAVDLGATSGRTILGTFAPEGLEMEVINRFPNHLIPANGHFYWDIYELYRNIIEGLKLVAQRDDVLITSIGIDTWGCDFVMVGQDGGFLRLPYAYRDPHTEGAPEKFFERVPRSQVYGLTGIQIMNFNTLFQFDTLRRNNDTAYAFLINLFNLLCGEVHKLSIHVKDTVRLDGIDALTHEFEILVISDVSIKDSSE